MSAEQAVSKKPVSLLLAKLLQSRAFDRLGRTGLDVGCGDGANTVLMARCGIKAIGVDTNPEALAAAESYRVTRGVGEMSCRFVQADARQLPEFEEPFDLVTVNEMLHFMPKSDQYNVLAAVRARTKRHGYNIISGYMLSHEVQDPNNRSQMLHPGELRRVYQQAGWTVRTCRETQMLPQIFHEHELVRSKSHLLAVPPPNHVPSA